MRQGVVAEAELQTEIPCDVPVVVGVEGRRLVDVMANGQGLEFGVASGDTHQHVHHAVTGEVVKRQAALGVAEELLILRIAVVAETELQGMHAVCPGDVNLGFIVLRGVMPGGRPHILGGVVRSPEGRDAGKGFGPIVEELAHAPAAGQHGVLAVGDVDDVAVVVQCTCPR